MRFDFPRTCRRKRTVLNRAVEFFSHLVSFNSDFNYTSKWTLYISLNLTLGGDFNGQGRLMHQALVILACVGVGELFATPRGTADDANIGYRLVSGSRGRFREHGFFSNKVMMTSSLTNIYPSQSTIVRGETVVCGSLTNIILYMERYMLID